MKRVLFALLMWAICGSGAKAQTYGNEWIDYGKVHYKILIAEKGIYRITPAELPGFVPSANDVSNMKVFTEGAEIPIYVIDANSNGMFDTNDVVEFYAEGNDGTQDTPLFSDNKDNAGVAMNHQAHTKKSLFTDTAAYFLTISSSAGMRYSALGAGTIAGTAETHYIHEETQVLSERYHYGRLILQRSYRADYNEGEGWVGNNISKGNSRDLNFSTPNLFAAGGLATLETVIVGDSKDDFGRTPDHHIRLLVGPNTGSLTQVEDNTFTGYTPKFYSKTFANTGIGANTVVRYSVINDLSLTDDNISPCYATIKYPRTFDLNSTSTRDFSFTGTGPGSSRVSFTNYNKSAPLLYDRTNMRRYRLSMTGSTAELMLQGAGANKDCNLIDSTELKSVASVKAVNFRNIYSSSRNYEFVILADESMLTGAQTYSVYRADATSLGGGGYDTLVLTVDQVVDQFIYGIRHHPRSIRNLVNYMIAQQTTDPDFLFLLGKGYQTDLLNQSVFYNSSYVPVYGAFGSDNMLTYGVNGTEYEPAIAVGRVSVKSNQEILDYLAKVKFYEHQNVSEHQRKVLGVSGGNKTGEPVVFGGYLDEFMTELQNGSIAPEVVRYDLDLDAPQTVNPEDYVRATIDSGLLLYEYFGHGADLSIAVELGAPSGYNNFAKYPFMFFSGCRVGNAFGSKVSVGESFVLEPNLGAIGWLAQTDLGYQTFLRDWGVLFNRNLSQNMYGQPLGKIAQKTADDYLIVSDLSIIHAQTSLLQVDPALALSNFSSPDFRIRSIDVVSEDFNSASDSIQIAIEVQNLGVKLSGNQDLKIEHQRPNGSVVTYPLHRVPNPSNTDVVLFTLDLQCDDFSGINNIIVTADASVEHAELDETNNRLVWSLYIPETKALQLSPAEFSIVSSSNVDLVFQGGNVDATGKSYSLQIDTTHEFNSPWVQSTTIVPTYADGKWNLNLPMNNQVYYWRVKLSSATNYEGYSSFTYINGSSNGWNQGDFGQFDGIEGVRMELDNPSETFSFIRDQGIITSKVNRALSGPPGANIGLRIDQELMSGGWSCGHKMLGLKVNAVDLSPSNYVNCNGTRPRRTFDIANAAGRTDLENFIGALPTGDFIALMTVIGGGQHLQASSSLLMAMSSLGADTVLIKALTNNHNYAFVAKKGFPNLTSEDTTITSGNYDDRAIAEIVGETTWFEGGILSEPVGPSTGYSSLDFGFTHPGTAANDNLSVAVIGIRANGTRDTVLNNLGSPPYNLASINASTYPYIQLYAKLADYVDRSPAQLDFWKVLYTGGYETGILVDAAFSYVSDTLIIGDSLKVNYKLKNFSALASDSIDLTYNLNSATSTIFSQTTRIAPLAASSERSMYFSRKMSVVTGDYTLDIIALPVNSEFEESLENNSETFKTHIKTSNPLPVQYLNLEAGYDAQTKTAKLEWTALSSDPIEDYIIERSNDANSFVELARVAESRVSDKELISKAEDALASFEAGTYYYRVKANAIDGSNAYSNLVSIEHLSNLSVKVFPVPARNSVNLEVSNPMGESVLINVIDAQGKTVLSNIRFAVSEGSSILKLNLDRLSSGVYTVEMTSGNQKVNKELILTK